MRQSILLLAIVAMLASCGGQGNLQGTSDLATEMDSISYSIGNFLSGQLTDLGITANPQEMGKGLAAVNADNAYMNAEETVQYMQNFQLMLQQRQGAPFTADDPSPFSADTLSYLIGADFARNMSDFDLSFSEAPFLQGAIDAGGDAESLVGGMEDQMMQNLTMMIQEKQMAMQAEMQAQAAEKAEVYIAEGTAFIAEKAQEAGVQSTASGLHYKVVEAGSGAKPGPTDQVTVHYEGRLIDGTVFDSSYERNEPTSFPLNRVIPGWTEGLQLMSPGAKYQFYIPQDLAYGLNSPPDIPPGSTLIFDVELISVLSQQ
ncbi:MAG: FKBP-type peptidyl-prolyl cis-trans isomerase [Bacteroidota bacterium]